MMKSRFQPKLSWRIITICTNLLALYVVVHTMFIFSLMWLISVVCLLAAAALFVLFLRSDFLNLFYVAEIDLEEQTLTMGGKWFERAVFPFAELKKIVMIQVKGKADAVLITAGEKTVKASIWSLSADDAQQLGLELEALCKQLDIPYETDAAAEVVPEEEVDEAPELPQEQEKDAAEDGDVQEEAVAEEPVETEEEDTEPQEDGLE